MCVSVCVQAFCEISSSRRRTGLTKVVEKWRRKYQRKWSKAKEKAGLRGGEKLSDVCGWTNIIRPLN